MNKAIKKSVFLVFMTILLICFTLPSSIYADSEKIVFSSYQDGDTSEIYIMDTNGSNPTRLTNNTGNDSRPSISPDGSKIVFDHDKGRYYEGHLIVNREIYLMNIDGSGLVSLTDDDYEDYNPSFSPDGAKIVFDSNRGGGQEIYKMNIDGSNITRLTTTSATNEYPSYSPDGSKIVFTSNNDGDFDIYVMDEDGSNVTNLTNNTSNDFTPSYSPDGSKIVFTSNRDGDVEIYVMDPDGSDPISLTSNAIREYNPVFSADGTKIIFSSDSDGDDEIYIMNSDGSGTPVKLTNNNSHDMYPFAGIARSSGSSGGASNPQFNEQSVSEYSKTTGDFVTFLYNRILNRAPDEEGYRGWVEALENNALKASDLVYRFINSDECQTDISGYNNEEFITFLYKVLFNRAPDPEGYENWLSHMNEGMDKNEVIINFCNTNEFEDICNYFGDI